MESTINPTQVNPTETNPALANSPEAGPTFTSLGINPVLLENAAGFTTPTAIQVGAIPPMLEGHDLLGQAYTGSGKTAAFALPILQRLKLNNRVEALVLAPTRELAKQISQEFERFGKSSQIRTVVVVGGESSYRQIELINRGAPIVVATPGRMLDLLQGGRLKNFAPQTVVLDEADEMLDMGFIDDIKTILGMMPKDRQTVMFSATVPGPIARLAQEIMNEPVSVRLGQDRQEKGPDIEQRLYVVKSHERSLAVARLLEVEEPEKSIIFCRTKRDVDDLDLTLRKSGLKCRAIHGDMAQGQRDQVIGAFKQGDCRILIATDVASRGLDIADVSHVINYHIPDNSERFTHRIGRTGRAGKKGVALTMATPDELRNHGFFKFQSFDRMNICAIPSKSQLETKKSATIADSLLDAPKDPRAKLIAARLLIQDIDAEELLTQAISLIMADMVVSGPEMIGFSLDQLSAMRQQRSSGPRSAAGGGGSGSRRPGGFSSPRRTTGAPQRDRRPQSSDRRSAPVRKPDGRATPIRRRESMN